MWNRKKKAIADLKQRVKVAEEALVILRGYTTALLAMQVGTLNSMTADDRLILYSQLTKLIAEPFKLTGTNIWPMNDTDTARANAAFSQMIQTVIRILEGWPGSTQDRA
ncbi:MAG: hypothetical protein J2P54_13540 [Bradyrhizobiaceae bacterium]|nr:hypothetical protein [Bradyrhizobiaceae bacterium]